MKNPELEDRLKCMRKSIRRIIYQKLKEKNLKAAELANIIGIKTVILKKYGYLIRNLDVAIFFLICEKLDINIEEIKMRLKKS